MSKDNRVLRYTPNRVSETSSILLRRIVRSQGLQPVAEKADLIKQAIALIGESVTLPAWIPKVDLPDLTVPPARDGYIIRDIPDVATAETRARMVKVEHIDRVLEEYGIEAENCTREAKLLLMLNLRDSKDLPLERLSHMRLILQHNWKAGHDGAVMVANVWMNEMITKAVQAMRELQSQRQKRKTTKVAREDSSGSEKEEDEEEAAVAEEEEAAVAEEDSVASDEPAAVRKSKRIQRKKKQQPKKKKNSKRKRVHFALDGEEKSTTDAAAADNNSAEEDVVAVVDKSESNSFCVRVRREVDHADLQAEVERTQAQFPAYTVTGKVFVTMQRIVKSNERTSTQVAEQMAEVFGDSFEVAVSTDAT